VTSTRTRLTPVEITEQHPSFRTGRTEAWAAVSKDGEYAFTRVEDTGTPWTVEHLPTGTDCGLFSSLPKARRATADGSALASAERPLPPELAALRADLIASGWTADSPAVPDRETKDLYAQERTDYED